MRKIIIIGSLYVLMLEQNLGPLINVPILIQNYFNQYIGRPDPASFYKWRKGCPERVHVVYYPRSNGKSGTSQNRSNVLWFKPLENATSCNLIVHSLTWLIAACFLVSHVLFFWGRCANISITKWNPFLTLKYSCCRFYGCFLPLKKSNGDLYTRNCLPLKKGFLNKFYNLLQFMLCIWFLVFFRAGKEGDCFISVNTNLAQLLCSDALVSC